MALRLNRFYRWVEETDIEEPSPLEFNALPPGGVAGPAMLQAGPSSGGEATPEESTRLAFTPSASTEIFGTDGSEQIDGTAGVDTIYAMGSTDWIFAGDGADLVYGCAGDDQLHGGNGADVLTDWEGANLFFGDGGDDRIVAGGLSADISGGDGNDTIESYVGGTIWGDAGDDTISVAGATVQTIYGGMGNDTISSIGGVMNADGGAGVDTIIGGAGNDTINGGSDFDIMIGGAGNDRIFGGSGYSAFSTDGNLCDYIEGGEGDDFLCGDYDPFEYYGMTLMPPSPVGGDDYVHGGAGNDRIYGGAGVDQLWGGDGNDYLNDGAGDDWLSGDAGNDGLAAGHGYDHLWGGKGLDSFAIDTNRLPWETGRSTAVIHDFDYGETLSFVYISYRMGGPGGGPTTQQVMADGLHITYLATDTEVILLGVNQTLNVTSGYIYSY